MSSHSLPGPSFQAPARQAALPIGLPAAGPPPAAARMAWPAAALAIGVLSLAGWGAIAWAAALLMR